MVEFVDLEQMPGFDPEETGDHGSTSITDGDVILVSDYLNTRPTPHCVDHGAMLKVSHDGIWRCIECNVGAWEEELYDN